MIDAIEQLRQSENTHAQLSALREQVDAYLKQQAALEQSRNAGNDR